jgi:N-dimethylarginine dimethylaminohydrolase
MLSATFPFNRRLLATDARHIDAQGINAHEQPTQPQGVALAVQEHEAVMAALVQAGVTVERIPCPPECQDGVFTANWGLVWKGRALLSRLPNARQSEEPVAEAALKQLGFATKRASVLFSGQGDAMIIGGNRVLIGGGYRTDPAVGREVRDWLGLEPIMTPARPKRRWRFGPRQRNRITGLRDSYFYDIDIAIGVLRADLIAVCLEALTAEGRRAIKGLRDVEVIPVDYREARYGLACNLVSTGETVVMSDEAPKLAAELRSRGLQVVELSNRQLRKSGGGFRCITLSLYD